MRPQAFPSDNFNFMPRFCCHGSGGGCPTRRPTTTSSPFSSWPRPAAGYIPEMMRPRPRCGAAHQHQPGPEASQHQTPFSHTGAAFMPPSDIDEVISMAQGFLGDLFGQRPATPTPDTQNRGQSADKPSPSQESGEGSCRKKAPATSRPKAASGATQKLSRQERRNESQPSSSARKTEEQATTEKSPRSQSQTTQPNSSQWSHSLYFSSFTPNKVRAKVRNGQVLIRASHETASGPGACLSKVEVTRTVALPENVDQKTLTAVMKLDGTLVLQAQLREGRSDEQKAAERTETPASQLENRSTAEKEDEEMEGSELKPERKPAMATSQKMMEISTHQEEKNVTSAEQKSEMPRLQDEADSLEPLENKANHQALENKADHQALENKADHQALENKADHQALENKADKMKALEDRSENMHALEKAEDTHALESKTEVEGNNTGLHRNNLEPAAAAERPDDSESPQPAEKNERSTEKIDDDAVAEEQHHLPDDEAQVMDDDCTTSSPYVEEPEEESLSIGEELSPPSSMEDFVIIQEDSMSSEKTEAGDYEEAMTTKNIQRFEELVPQDQAHTEDEMVKEDTNGKISTSDQTDPTRPIKRSQEPMQDSAENLTPKEQSATVGNMPATGPAHGGIFRVSLPLQGFSPEDVHVKLVGHTLRITAKRQSWLGDVSYTEKVEKELELPGHLDVLTVKCVYEQHVGCLVISAQPHSLQHQVPVMVQ